METNTDAIQVTATPNTRTTTSTQTPEYGILAPTEEEVEYPKTRNVIFIMLGLLLATFLVALDRTIIATAIPAITNEFNSLGDVGWYSSAYLLTNCSLVVVYGRIYSFCSPKLVYMACIFLFEAGSAVCGAAPRSSILIAGRAVAGTGSAGIFSGSIIIMVHTVPLHKRPLYMAMLGSMWGLASSVGPIMGGALTSKLSWRWCFYINLPIGAIAFLVVGFLVVIPVPNVGGPSLSIYQKFARLDPLGIICFLPGTVCLLLALQLGGSTYAWNDARIIAALVVFAVLILVFIVIQVAKKDTALIPPRIITHRSIAAAAWFAFWLGASMLMLTFYLPIWFQAIQGVDAFGSGVRVIPLVLTLNIVSITTGIIMRFTGYSAPFMLLSSVLMALGTGFITTWTVHTPPAKWIGYQVLYGAGIGFGLEQPPLLAQTVLSREDIPVGASCIVFFQSLGGAIFTSVGQNVLTYYLALSLKEMPELGLNASDVTNIGATELRKLVDPSHLGALLLAYNSALVKVFRVAVGLACASIIGAASVNWVSTKKGRRLSRQILVVQAPPTGQREKADSNAVRSETV
ncbi:Efflux pump [Lachnellula occidentalis]|uniref:Efflux pump n=1 Tax=Lachnellula occidentalis TaxID=215460 RepID=A0A8H8UAG9_9HELO|nr:Efflux pump [Lachnellula occidentalis]